MEVISAGYQFEGQLRGLTVVFVRVSFNDSNRCNAGFQKSISRQFSPLWRFFASPRRVVRHSAAKNPRPASPSSPTPTASCAPRPSPSSHHIVNGGDLGGPDILARLRAIAPLSMVRGNNDGAPWAADIPVSQTVTAGGIGLHVVRDIADL